MAGRYVGFGKKLFDLAKGESKSKVATTIVGVTPKVNKTKLDEAKSKLAKTIQKGKATSAKLKQTQFEIANKAFKGDDFTFATTNKKTPSNTELKKAKKAFKKEDKKETKTKHFYAPENFNKGGRVGLKGGGVDMGSPTNRAIMTLKERLKNRKKSKIPKNSFNRKRSPMEVNRVISKMKSDAQAMGGDFKTASELKPLKGESKKSFESRPSTKFFNKGGRVGLKRGGGKFPDHSGDGKITKKDILMAKGVIPKPKKSKSPMDKAVRKS